MVAGADYVELENALVGLNFQSESDFPLEFVCWQKSKGQEISASFVLGMLGESADASIEEGDADELLSSLSKVESWYDEEEKTNALGFENLHQLFKQKFSSLKLFRVGQIEVSVLVLADDEGHAVGFRTTSIET